jgi:hypothetical protein
MLIYHFSFFVFHLKKGVTTLRRYPLSILSKIEAN